jgi:hypothetical protein
LTTSPAAALRLHHQEQLTPTIPAHHQHNYTLASVNMATTVHVKNIGAQTEDKEIKDFFSFW